MMKLRQHPQRGAALLTALIIVTLVASLAAGMVWQQYRAVQTEAAERARSQGQWILRGALDWARLILREDAQANRNQAVDHLAEPWAVPLAEAKLNSFLGGSDADAADTLQAFLSGQIEDAQGRYNLRALLEGPELPAPELRTLQRLCEYAHIAPQTALVIAQNLRRAWRAGSAASAGAARSASDQELNGPLPPVDIDELSWLGVDAATLDALRPFVVLLPKPTPVNLNTAPREVIAALFDGMDLGAATRLVQSRLSQPLQNLSEAQAFVPGSVQITPERASVNSSFFIVTGQLRLHEQQLTQRALVERRGVEVVELARHSAQQLSPLTSGGAGGRPPPAHTDSP